MPHFYFDTFDGNRNTRDDQGMDLPDLKAARAEAQRELPDLVRDVLPDGDHRVFACMVRDVGGAYVYRVILTLTGIAMAGSGDDPLQPPDDTALTARTLLRGLGRDGALNYASGKMQELREGGDLRGAVGWGKVTVAIVDAAREAV